MFHKAYNMNRKRVVITGIGVVAPNATGVDEFAKALYDGKSGITYHEESKELNFGCQIGGIPKLSSEYMSRFLPDIYLKTVKNSGIIYGCLAGLEAWSRAGLNAGRDRKKKIGMVFGSGATGMDSFSVATFDAINGGRNRVLGTTIIPQSMNSGTASYLNQILGLGGPVLSNSSACSTGSEAILLGYEQIQLGKSDIMLCGSTEGIGRYIWGAFDSMRIMCSNSNDNPEFGSRPMSDSSSGFVPSGGAGAVILETLESAQSRGAHIYAELLSGFQNCGGMRDGGSITAPNPIAASECVAEAIKIAQIDPREIDLISGHLTSTRADPLEIEIWTKGLKLSGEDFPFINTPKSMIGHCIAGAGSVESVACILQISNGFMHRNINLTAGSIHPRIADQIDSNKVILASQHKEINTVIKSNFGFGDVNCTLIFRKFSK
jgi:3-oxoacyl-(acyl-carrier-protein) synthase